MIRGLKYLGLDAYQLRDSRIVPAGSDRRPVGRMDLLLQDLKARGFNCRAVLDVGANRTFWSRTAIRYFPEAKFYLIEPQQELENELQRFCREHESASYFLTGVGSKKEDQIITIWDDLAGSSFMPEVKDALLQQGKQRSVSVTTIDTLIQEEGMEMPDLIKMDIQGYELEALRGANLTFGETKAYILEVALYEFMEGMPVFDEVIGFMRNQGYVVYDFGGFLRRPSDGALSQCDICFVKEQGLLRKSNQW